MPKIRNLLLSGTATLPVILGASLFVLQMNEGALEAPTASVGAHEFVEGEQTAGWSYAFYTDMLATPQNPTASEESWEMAEQYTCYNCSSSSSTTTDTDTNTDSNTDTDSEDNSKPGKQLHGWSFETDVLRDIVSRTA